MQRLVFCTLFSVLCEMSETSFRCMQVAMVQILSERMNFCLGRFVKPDKILSKASRKL